VKPKGARPEVKAEGIDKSVVIREDSNCRGLFLRLA
jgi:hypothetical protein